jgi:hypothetical protein
MRTPEGNAPLEDLGVSARTTLQWNRSKIWIHLAQDGDKLQTLMIT